MAHAPAPTSHPSRPPRQGLGAAWKRMREDAAARASTPSPDHDVRAARADAPLTDREREVLDFEARPWAQGGAKMAAIRETFGWSETRYLQVLRGLLEREAALEHAPALVWRLREQLQQRR